MSILEVSVLEVSALEVSALEVSALEVSALKKLSSSYMQETKKETLHHQETRSTPPAKQTRTIN